MSDFKREEGKPIDKKDRKKAGTLGTISSVEVGKAGNKRKILGVEKSAGRLGADESKISIPSDGKKSGQTSKPEKRVIGTMGVRGTSKIPKRRSEWNGKAQIIRATANQDMILNRISETKTSQKKTTLTENRTKR
jgi:hypothetical protein